MLKKSNLNYLFSALLLLAFSVAFYSCQDKEEVLVEDNKVEQMTLKGYLADHTQQIKASDMGNGTYEVIGASGTKVEVKNALVNAKGERVRGEVEVELIEIYTVPEMILLRKQTLSDDNGQLGILESGGEVFLKISQNGEELSLDGTGTLNILLPADNTGGVRPGMEVYLGEETGDQVIWKPTGDLVRVIYPTNRNEGALYLIQNILGWVNVDILGQLPGDPVDCLAVEIECDIPCPGAQVTVSLYVNSLNSAFEIPFMESSTFALCGGFPLGGMDVTIITVVECPDGTLFTNIKTVTVNSPNHLEIIKCSDLQPTDFGTFEMALQNLIQ